MKTFVVTGKVKPHPAHNPRDKISGRCPAFEGHRCTDITGAHHSTQETFAKYFDEEVSDVAVDRHRQGATDAGP